MDNIPLHKHPLLKDCYHEPNIGRVGGPGRLIPKRKNQTTRFFGVPGCTGSVYWHQRFVDSVPELKWAGAADPRLLRNPPEIYLEEYPRLQRDIMAARPVYTPDENLPVFIHVDFLVTSQACMAHMQLYLDTVDFEKVVFRDTRTHETCIANNTPVTAEILVQRLVESTECIVKLKDRCFLYRAVTPATPFANFLVMEINSY